MDNWWTTEFWSGSTKLCNKLRKHIRWFALKYFFGLHIKSLIAPKIFGAALGIGGQLPLLPPPGYASALGREELQLPVTIKRSVLSSYKWK